jgi:ATP-dependent protease HslVU (ClpYQ) peptidase subunit
MSTVVGIVASDRIVLAADRRADTADALSDPVAKLWCGSNLAVGIAGDLQDFQILTDLFKDGASDLSRLRSVVTEFRNSLEKLGRVRPNTAEYGSCKALSHFLIATPYGLFHLETEFLLRPIRTFWAIGSGRDFALGVVGYMRDRGMVNPKNHPDIAARAAVEVASMFDPWTGDGVDIEVVMLVKEGSHGKLT